MHTVERPVLAASVAIADDVFDYTSPLGILGRMADRLFLVQYMRRLLEERNAIIKTVAESEQWQRFVPASVS